MFEILCDQNDSDSSAALAIRENEPIDVSSWSGVSTRTRIGNGSLPVGLSDHLSVLVAHVIAGDSI